MIPSLKLLSKVCFPFLGYSLLPNINCHNCRRPNGPVRKTTRSVPRHSIRRDPPGAPKPPLPRGDPTLPGGEAAPGRRTEVLPQHLWLSLSGTGQGSPSATLPRSPRVKPTRNPAGVWLLPCLGVRSLLPGGLGDLLCFPSFHEGTIGQGSNKMTWGTPCTNTRVPSVKVQTQPSLARRLLVPTTALLAVRPDCQILAQEGGGGIKDHCLHANLARITSLRQEK